MRFILTLIILCIFQFSFSQNWSPLVIGKTANFKLNNSYRITNCIWVTDTIVDIDTSFTLNKIAIKLEENPEILLRNSPQFLQEEMIKKDNGDYIFSGSNNYVIKSYSEFGETWLFDTLNNLTAKTTLVSTEEVLGNMDSVKIFQLFIGDSLTNWEIKLSKNFGLIKFPDFDTAGHYFLCGFQNDTLGEQVVGFWDITNYSIDDVFEYRGTDANGGNGYVEDFIKKYTITDKTVSNDTISYTIEGIYYGSVFDIWDPEQSYTYYYTFNQSLNYVYYPWSLVNKLPHELWIMTETEYVNDSSIDGLVYTQVIIDTNEQGLRKKIIGGNNNLYYLKEINSDTLYQIPNTAYEYYGKLMIIYTELLGNTYYKEEWFEGYYQKTLTGYIKDGDTIGNITADSVLVSNPKSYDADPIISVTPNPATSRITLSLKNNYSKPWSFRIINLNGITVFQKKDLFQDKISFDISGLKPGTYLYQLIIDRKESFNGKLIKL